MWKEVDIKFILLVKELNSNAFPCFGSYQFFYEALHFGKIRS